MKRFLQELADRVKADYPNWDQLKVVFPNRRATLYFKQELIKDLDKPRWVPTIITIEELIQSYSNSQEADKLELIFRLYQSFKRVTHSEEKIDQFYYWGEMLLRDFDELDKYMVNVEWLFRDINHLKEVDQYFDFLTEEQKEFLKEFWQSVEFSTEETRKRFLSLWQNLFPVYQDFQRHLKKDAIGYAGMIHRAVAEQLLTEKGILQQQIVFAGFNALTTAEEKIISWFVENQHARIFWDEDEFYVGTEYREAGTFFRRYRLHPVLGKTFQRVPPSHFSKPKQLHIYGVSQKVGQPKLLAQQLLNDTQLANSESHVIVLPDESLLMPLLYSIPAEIQAINVTMGYPLISTPYFSLIDFLFDLHRTKRKDEFYHRSILPILNHPFLHAIAAKEVHELTHFIVNNNQVYLEEPFFQSKGEIVALLFRNVNETDFIDYLLNVINRVATSSAQELLDKEFAFYFHRMLTRIQLVFHNEAVDLAMLQKIFRQIARLEKIPFSGEPLKGIQVMGVLETRNLDFDHVHVLSLNEGLWPASPRHGSYLPHSIRKAYGLSTYVHQDAMYAYLFYRLLQRSKYIHLYYNTEPDVVGTKEMSRYIYQIMYEAPWPYTKNILSNSFSVKQPMPISIPKDVNVLERLHQYTKKVLTPSALNTYLECRLRFYFKNIIGLHEVAKVEETADARIFGNLFHDVMQFFYTDLKPVQGDWEIRKEHFVDTEKKLELLLERAYRKHFHLAESKKVRYDGQQLIVNEMVKKMAEQVLKNDLNYAPFTIEMLEVENFHTEYTMADKWSVMLGGKIDRVDRKENEVRIIDYKTGKDENDFESIKSLFNHTDQKRNKAAFQAFFYAWVYARKVNENGLQLQPGLINRKMIFNEKFQYGLVLNKHLLKDVTPYLLEFENNLVQLLQEIFDPNQPLDQTTDANKCAYCPYKEICGR